MHLLTIRELLFENSLFLKYLFLIENQLFMSNKQVLTIFKIGGNVVDNDSALQAFLSDFSAVQGAKILVHGGGKVADKILTALGIVPQKVEGRRITDAATLEVVTQVYAGSINKKIVAGLQKHNCPALGVSGADANLIKARKRIAKNGIDYGFVGDIDAVDTEGVNFLLQRYTLVFSAITHDKNGNLLNTNADTIASTLAIAMSQKFEVILKFVFEKQGVLRDVQDENSVIERIDATLLAQGKADKIFFDGMIPKLDNAFAALQAGVKSVFICGTEGVRPDTKVAGTLLTL